MEQHPEQFRMYEVPINDGEQKEEINEPSLMDRISGWFTEDNVI